jgi:APA family basic amino acid/polyamine antiporter
LERRALKTVFLTKKVDDILADATPSEGGFRRALNAFDLTLFGVGAIVGAGIFATIGTAAAGSASRPGAGPSLILSFVITAVVCSFIALCYAELAATVPISGSAYTYAYATLGELVAWIIGWDLILEYAISNVAIAISWSNYMRVLLEGVGIAVPPWLCTDLRTAHQIPGLLEQAPHIFGVPIVFNSLAMLVVAGLTALVLYGIRESARVNTLIVLIKIAVLIFFVGAAATFATSETVVRNWQPFFPNGWTGTFTGAAIVFFAYVGFDSVSTVAEETKNPGRNMPVGIIASLIVCTVLYLGVTAVFTGLLPYDVLVAQMANEQAEPLTLALRHVAPQAAWAGTIIALGAVIAQTAAILVYQIAQPRIFYVMARDGLLPKVFAAVHPRYKTPHVATLVTGVLVGGISAFASIDEMVDLTNIGTLFAFVIVCVGVPVLRLTDPNRARPFKVPFGPYLVPALGASTCIGLMWYLPPASWWRFIGWLVLGLAIYAFYGYARSTLGRRMGRSPVTPPAVRKAGWSLLCVAAGLFALPHDASLPHVVAAAFTGDSPDTLRAWLGLVLIGLGLATLGVLALLSRRRNAAC